MPTIRADDGVSLYYEEADSGTPMVFIHEYAGDHRSGENLGWRLHCGEACLAPQFTTSRSLPFS